MNYSFNKNDICFITARAGFPELGLDMMGIKHFRPYVSNLLLLHYLRVIWFKLKLPETCWYNKRILETDYKYYFVDDPLITSKYLVWFSKNVEGKKIFLYNNTIGTANHVYPSKIPTNFSVWTFDYVDAKKYDINHYTHGGYMDVFKTKKQKLEYDIVFVGADKGRGEYLQELNNEFREMGLNTKFIITKEQRFDKNKEYYSKHISYLDLVNLNSKSKAILNIQIGKQHGYTLRDFEALFNEKKLITNNPDIVNAEFYNKNNVFVLNKNNIKDVKNFLLLPYIKIDEKIMEKYTFYSLIEEIIVKIDTINT